jgi:hypothetical protein
MRKWCSGFDGLDANRHTGQMRHARQLLDVFGRAGHQPVDVGAARLVGPSPSARALVAPAVRDGDDTRDDVLGDNDRDLDLAVRRGDSHHIPVDDVREGRVVDMHPGVLHAVAPHQQRRVVHPRVLRARLPHADQPHRIAVWRAAP